MCDESWKWCGLGGKGQLTLKAILRFSSSSLGSCEWWMGLGLGSAGGGRGGGGGEGGD